jgi:hypothetical protein
MIWILGNFRSLESLTHLQKCNLAKNREDEKETNTVTNDLASENGRSRGVQNDDNLDP